MSGILNRRDFLSMVQYAGMAIPFTKHFNLVNSDIKLNTPQLQNDYFSVDFDKRSGRLNIARRDGEKFLSGSVARAITGQELLATSQPEYKHSVDIHSYADLLGEGQQLVVRSASSKRNIDFELTVSLYKNHHAVFIEALCQNLSKQPVVIQRIEPIFCAFDEGGALFWPQTLKLLTNGPMYYNPGEVVDFDLPDKNVRQSWWNVCLFSGYNREGLSIGAIENQTAQGRLSAKREAGDAIGLTLQSILADGFLLGPGRKIRSNRFILNVSKDPYSALENYAEIMGIFNKARVHSLVNGWCNWFFTYEHIDEEEVIRNAEFAARILKPYGLEYIQVDEGYQIWHGDWEGNSRFPHGMKWLADQIHALGLKPGLWIAPFVISEPTDIFRKHKEWLLKNPDSSLKRVGPWPDENSEWARNENPKRYGLDITEPDAAEWMYNLFYKISKQWGYDMIKIDFVDWSLLSAHKYYDPSFSRAMAYRKGFEIIRQAIGADCHLQDCGPGPVTVGLIDSMRIELDQNYGYSPEVWKQYFTNSASSAPAAAKRYYFHKRTWINDADHLCINLLSYTRAQAAATLISLTGGNLFSGDRLPDLDPIRLEILKKTLPSYGEAARPVDLFDTDQQKVFSLTIRKPYGEWTIVGLFNSDPSYTDERTLPLNRLWLNDNKTYISYDFWNDRYFGEVTGELKVRIPPASVVLLSLHEKLNIPQIISSDRHILQGAIELSEIRWDPESKTLHGISTGPLNSAHNVSVFIPEAHPWRQGGISLYHDFPGYTLKMTDDHILRVHVRFENDSKVSWKINFPEFFKTD